MIVEIEKGLESIKEELEKRGYETFYSGENKIADAILYSGEDFPRVSYDRPYIEVLSARNNRSSRGALLINVDKKDIDEIVFILNNRRYSPLF